MATRKEVYEAIDSERDYQDSLWRPVQSRGDHSVTEFLLYIEDYVAEARKILARTASPLAEEQALPVLRKIAALAVSCMEQHDAPMRDPSDIHTAKDRHGGI